MPEFPPIAHIAVTVTDLGRSTRWYSVLLAAEPVLDEDAQRNSSRARRSAGAAGP